MLHKVNTYYDCTSHTLQYLTLTEHPLKHNFTQSEYHQQHYITSSEDLLLNYIISYCTRLHTTPAINHIISSKHPLLQYIIYANTYYTSNMHHIAVDYHTTSSKHLLCHHICIT